VDEKKAQKLKILVLVVLGGLCVGLAVPRVLNTRPKVKTAIAKPNPDEAGAKKVKDAGPTKATGESRAATAKPKSDPYPVNVGQEIVKDPFSPPFLSSGDTEPPPAADSLGGGHQLPSGRDLPWGGSPGSDVRPPVLVTDGGLPGMDKGPNNDTPPQVNKGPGYQLTGVIRGESTIAIIRSDTARYYAKVGDRLGGGYSVRSISGDRVTLSGPSGTQVLFVGRS
jgi:hypothetical protein